MDDGVFALLLGFAAMTVLVATPAQWLKAAGGLLILVTVVIIGLQLLWLA